MNKFWTDSIQPKIEEYISIDNLSRAFDSEWNTNGKLEKAAHLLKKWVEDQKVPGLTIEYFKDEDKSPLLFFEVPGTTNDTETVLFYGHFDKQVNFCNNLISHHLPVGTKAWPPQNQL